MIVWMARGEESYTTALPSQITPTTATKGNRWNKEKKEKYKIRQVNLKLDIQRKQKKKNRKTETISLIWWMAIMRYGAQRTADDFNRRQWSQYVCVFSKVS